MKHYLLLMMAVLSVALFGACDKEDNGGSANGLRLFAEGMGGSKVAVEGLASYWVADEHVWVSNQDLTIAVDGEGNATVTGENISTPYKGVYPYSILSSNDGNSVTLSLPANYAYTTDGSGRQTIYSPMVAYATSGDELYFKHVTAAIGVKVINYHDYAITLGAVSVSSNKYRLNGSVTVDLTDIDVAAAETETASERTVSVTFATPLNIAAGDSVIVQVPVLPVGSDNQFTIAVTVSNTTVSNVVIERQQASAHSLGRANIGYARYTLGGPFTVSSSKKVLFSTGNLQYHIKDAKWQFAPHQHDAIGAANSNIGNAEYDGWIDLFGWGTGDAPTKYASDATYTTFNDWGNYVTTDLGSGWYTLTKDEWAYLTTGSRSTSTYGLPSATSSTAAKYVKATVNSTSGLIIFPDNYTHPNGVTITSTISQYDGQYIAFDKFTVTSGWDKMELAGAIFLPVTGYRNVTSVDQSSTHGYYWSQNYTGTSGYSLYFYSSNLVAASTYPQSTQSYGHAVRLVKNL